MKEIVEASAPNYMGDSGLSENSIIGEPDIDFWLNHRKIYAVNDGVRQETRRITEAVVVSSELQEPIDRTSKFFGHEGGLTHRPVIDIDSPIRVIESSTPGHSHLYIEKAMTAEQMWKLLEVMAEVGLVEHGFVEASKSRGGTHVRLPWVRKKS